MSVVLNFNYLVIRKSAIEKEYPGGLASFRRDWMPSSAGDESEEDPYLLSFISMGPYLELLRERLVQCGLHPGTNGQSMNVFQETEVRGVGNGCEWLEFGKEAGFLVCWLKGMERGQLALAYLR